MIAEPDTRLRSLSNGARTMILALVVIVALAASLPFALRLAIALIAGEATHLPLFGLLACVAAPVVAVRLTAPKSADESAETAAVAATMFAGVTVATVLVVVPIVGFFVAIFFLLTS